MPDPVDTGATSSPDAAAVAAAAAAASATAWTTGLDAETIGHIQNRGWQDKPANEVALAAIQAHRAAEKLIGAPAEQLLRLPANLADADAMRSVYQKLGAPVDAAGYDFSAVKNAAGEAPAPALLDAVRSAAFAKGLSKEAATEIATAVVKYQDGTAASTAAEATAKLAEANAALKTNWGANFDANMHVAKQTALRLGVTPEAVAALEKATSYDKVMEMFRAIGQKTGEASFISNENGFNNGVMTKEQAVARKADLMNDSAWAKRYMDGGTQENRELQDLLAIIVG